MLFEESMLNLSVVCCLVAAVPSALRRYRVFLDILYRKLLSGRNNGASRSIFHPRAYSKGDATSFIVL